MIPRIEAWPDEIEPEEIESEDYLLHSLHSACERLGPALALKPEHVADVLRNLADWYAGTPLAITAVDPFAAGDPWAWDDREDSE